MKYIGDRPFADPETAARRLMEHARTFEPIHDGRIYIEKINAPFLLATRPAPPNTRPVSTSRLSAAGSSCTKAAPIFASYRPAPIYSHNKRVSLRRLRGEERDP
jgi:hypothetical protein